jgi:hypothetical protein
MSQAGEAADRQKHQPEGPRTLHAGGHIAAFGIVTVGILLATTALVRAARR